MHSTARIYFDATVALAIMATLGVIAGFVAIAATGDRLWLFRPLLPCSFLPASSP